MDVSHLKNARVEPVAGIPRLTVDGEVIGPVAYQWRLNEKSAHQLEALGSAGVKLYFLRVALREPEKYEAFMEDVRAHVSLLREKVPDALVILWLSIDPYEEFGEKYPDEVITFEDMTTGGWTQPAFFGLKDRDATRYSFASDVWKSEVVGLLRRTVRDVNQSDLSECVIGYFLFAQACEWNWFWDYDDSTRCFDFSPAMCRAFKNFLIEKYAGDVSLLRKAWKDDEVTFDTARVPGFAARAATDSGFFRDPAKRAQVLDYIACHAEVMNDKLTAFARVCKEESGGKAVTGAFWGYFQNQNYLWGGQARCCEMLDSPYLDFWASPYTYENKGPGDFASMRFLIKTLQQHGKLWFSENDTFLHDTPVPSLMHHGYPFTTKEESREVLKRDFVYPLCEGTQAWWIDWSGGDSMYEEDGFLPLMRRFQEISRESASLPCDSLSEVAAVVDQASIPETSSPRAVSTLAKAEKARPVETAEEAEEKYRIDLLTSAIDRFRIHELPRLGTPVDFYETNDLFAASHRRHKVYIFLNAYSPDKETRRLIDKNFKKDGNMLIFMYGAGYAYPDGEKTLDAENIASLTGIHVKLLDQPGRARMKLLEGASKVVPGLEEGKEVGDFDRLIRSGFDFNGNDRVAFPPPPNRLSPVFAVDDPEASPLASYMEGTGVGMAIREFDDWISVYIGSTGMQSDVLRALCKKAGAFLYTEDRDVIVYANRSYLAIHTGNEGEVTLNLPDKYDATEEFDSDVLKNVDTIHTSVLPAGTTKLWRLDPIL